MASLDLDARRAEANLEDHKLTLGGKVYSLPAEMPLLFADRLQNEKIEEAIHVLFGPEDGGEVAPLLTGQDLEAIAQNLYGLDGSGEAPASPPSLNRAGRRAKPTSSASTG
jgi:hypothetical protein